MSTSPSNTRTRDAEIGSTRARCASPEDIHPHVSAPRPLPSPSPSDAVQDRSPRPQSTCHASPGLRLRSTTCHRSPAKTVAFAIASDAVQDCSPRPQSKTAVQDRSPSARLSSKMRRASQGSKRMEAAIFERKRISVIEASTKSGKTYPACSMVGGVTSARSA